MQWFIHFRVASSLVDHRLADLQIPGIVGVHTERPDVGSAWSTITVAVEADDAASAMDQAGELLRSRRGLGPTFRVTVEEEDAPTGYDLLSTGGIARRLGVSEPRVRQLAQRPDFPKPIDIPGLAGMVYATAQVDAWANTWDRDAKGGRPRRASD